MRDVRHNPQLQHTQEHSLAGGERRPTPSTHVRERVEISAGIVRAAWPHVPRAVLVLDSALSGSPEGFSHDATVDYAELPGFPLSTVDSVAGRLLCGHVGDRPVVILAGRFLASEGYPLQQITFPIRVAQVLGARELVVTAGCEALTADWAVGDIALVTDHINLLGDNPLVGPNDDSLGPRFPDMTIAYSPELAAAARARFAPLQGGVTVRDGVLAAVPGPSRPTDAECSMLRTAGADVVGMSMVPETIVGVHGGMSVLGLAVVEAVRASESGAGADADGAGARRRAGVEPTNATLAALIEGVLGRP